LKDIVVFNRLKEEKKEKLIHFYLFFMKLGRAFKNDPSYEQNKEEEGYQMTNLESFLY
jgi:hypothetical protein